jgi:signal transduction histidine kinase
MLFGVKCEPRTQLNRSPRNGYCLDRVSGEGNMTVTRTLELEQSNCRQADVDAAFIATVWHELRNPLASLRIALHLLGASARDPSAVSRLQARMVRQLEHLMQVVDDVLDTSRIRQGALRLRVERTNATEVVRMAVDMSEPLFHAASQQLRLDVPPDPLWIDVDPLRLTQIITNLLQNAAKYTNPQGVIAVSAGQRGERIEIVVQDTGIGMTPDELDTVFELFARSRQHAVRATDGLGIGLALARRLAEMHGGSLTATSDGLGSGSRFTLSLPSAMAPATTSGNTSDLFTELRSTSAYSSLGEGSAQ